MVNAVMVQYQAAYTPYDQQQCKHKQQMVDTKQDMLDTQPQVGRQLNASLLGEPVTSERRFAGFDARGLYCAIQVLHAREHIGEGIVPGRR